MHSEQQNEICFIFKKRKQLLIIKRNVSTLIKKQIKEWMQAIQQTKHYELDIARAD